MVGQTVAGGCRNTADRRAQPLAEEGDEVEEPRAATKTVTVIESPHAYTRGKRGRRILPKEASRSSTLDICCRRYYEHNYVFEAPELAMKKREKNRVGKVLNKTKYSRRKAYAIKAEACHCTPRYAHVNHVI